MTGDFPGIQPLRAKLAAVRRKQLICTAGTGVALVLVIAVALLSLGLVVDWLEELPWLARAFLLVVNLGLIGVITWRQIVVPVQATPNTDGCALLVEQALPEFRTRLIASVQLTRPGAVRTGESEAMVRVLVQQTAQLAAPVDFLSVVSVRQLLSCGLGALIMLVTAALALWLGAPTSGALLRRAFLGNIPLPHKTHTEVLTGNLKIGRGDTVVIAAQATGFLPAHGRLLLQSATGQPQEFTLWPVPARRAQFAQTLNNVQESFTYRVRLNDDSSGPFTVQVRERPVVTHLECRQVFPAYTHLAPLRRPPTDLTLLAGSQLQLTIRANKPIASATVRLTGLNTNAPARVSPLDPRQVLSEIPIPQAGLTGFIVQLCDEDGLHSQDMAVYPIDILPDHPPTVALTFPERREELVTQKATVVLGLDAHDDFGIARLALHYHSPALQQDQEQVVELDLAGATPRALHRRHEWRLATLAEALPLDTTIEYWLEAQDTNDVTGPGRAATEHYWLKVVSPDDKRADLLNRLDEALRTLGNLADDEDRVNQNLGTLIFGKTR